MAHSTLHCLPAFGNADVASHPHSQWHDHDYLSSHFYGTSPETPLDSTTTTAPAPSFTELAPAALPPAQQVPYSNVFDDCSHVSFTDLVSDLNDYYFPDSPFRVDDCPQLNPDSFATNSTVNFGAPQAFEYGNSSNSSESDLSEPPTSTDFDQLCFNLFKSDSSDVASTQSTTVSSTTIITNQPNDSVSISTSSKKNPPKVRIEYPCPTCGENFKTKSAMKVHRRIHQADKKYRCDICSKTFAWLHNLTQHLRLHNGDRPFKCHCGKGFLFKSKLVAHQKTHLKDKQKDTQLSPVTATAEQFAALFTN